jgi:hypothetical protein
MGARHTACLFLMGAGLCMLMLLLFPVVHAPFVVVHGPITVLRALRNISLLYLLIRGTLLVVFGRLFLRFLSLLAPGDGTGALRSQNPALVCALRC